MLAQIYMMFMYVFILIVDVRSLWIFYPRMAFKMKEK